MKEFFFLFFGGDGVFDRMGNKKMLKLCRKKAHKEKYLTYDFSLAFSPDGEDGKYATEGGKYIYFEYDGVAVAVAA